MPRDSPNTPGSTRETSSRESIRLRYCSAISTDQGATKSDSSAITATSGAANSSTGRSQAASDSPELNQITISESRQARFSVSSTAMNSVSDSRIGSRLSAEKPRNATTASDGNLPPAAWPSRRIRRVVSAIRNSVRKTATARLANSRSSVRRKIMRYLQRNAAQFIGESVEI